jgi:hypothetical protein
VSECIESEEERAKLTVIVMHGEERNNNNLQNKRTAHTENGSLGSLCMHACRWIVDRRRRREWKL